MTRQPPARDFAIGLVLKVLLDRLDRGGGSAAGNPGSTPAPRSAPPQASVKRRPLLLFMLGSLAIGLVLMLVFHAPVTRIVGMTALFAFIVSGVFLIADPAFLGPDEDLRSLEAGGRG
jgi:hypothetical protein